MFLFLCLKIPLYIGYPYTWTTIAAGKPWYSRGLRTVFCCQGTGFRTQIPHPRRSRQGRPPQPAAGVARLTAQGFFSKFYRKMQASPHSFPPRRRPCAWRELPAWCSGVMGSGSSSSSKQNQPGPGAPRAAGAGEAVFRGSLPALPSPLPLPLPGRPGGSPAPPSGQVSRGGGELR